MKLFRREWIFPALMVAFVSASAQATARDELSAQAAMDLHCNSVSIIQSSDTRFLATGCGQDRTYTCADDGTCSLDDDGSSVHASNASSGDGDEVAEAIAESIFDLGCACASAAASHGGGHHHASSGTHKKR